MKKRYVLFLSVFIILLTINFLLAEQCQNNTDCPGSTHCENGNCIANNCTSNSDCIGGWYCNSGKCSIVNGVNRIGINNSKSCDLSDLSKCDNSCSKDSDCKFSSCSCYNKDIVMTNNQGLSILCADSSMNCKCENNICLTANENKEVCGDGVCTDNEKAVLCIEPGLYPNGSMMPGGGCNIACPQDCNSTNKTLPGENKTKILPETASLRARERLGELGFNITLKEVPIKQGAISIPKQRYIAEAEKQGKFLGIFKVKAKVSAEIDSETGLVTKVHKPWWSFLAGI